MNKSIITAVIAIVAVAGGSPAIAADHKIELLTSGASGTMVFEPAAVEVEPGDTVTFVATDPGHNAETITGMLPEGAETFRTAFGETVTVTFDVPGVYGIKCTPHYAMGMIALVQVGDDPANLEAAKAVTAPPIAGQRFEAAFADLGI